MSDTAKRAVGEAAAKLVHSGMIIGLGTGSTAAYFIAAIGRRVREEGLAIQGVPTSLATDKLAQEQGIPTVALTPQTRPDLTVDGADEANPRLDLIKGGGGALVREKLVAAASAEVVIIADDSKRVATLGAFPLPIAVVPFAVPRLLEQLQADFGAHTSLRKHADGTPLITDDGLSILDLTFGRIPRPALLDKRLKVYTGVVETGLFVGIAGRIFYSDASGTVAVAYPVTE